LHKKLFLFMSIAGALLLSSCASLNPPAADQATPAPATSVQAGTPTIPATPECRVDTSQQIDPTMAALFPKSANEWAQGAESPAVTIVEYSDFQ
jgi:PBP1b-binding outer membrane lipoprotein LpoB